MLILITVAQTIEDSRAADATARLINHPSPEPVVVTGNWQTLAEKWARFYSVDARLVKAIVDAEGAQNISGDYDTNQVPHAFGYGQVWPKWHSANIQKAVLDVTGTSTNITDEQTLGKIILASNDISMATAVLAIRDTWVGIGSPTSFTNYSIYESFTKKYVGPAISQQDLQRRWQIWQKYFP